MEINKKIFSDHLELANLVRNELYKGDFNIEVLFEKQGIFHVHHFHHMLNNVIKLCWDRTIFPLGIVLKDVDLVFFLPRKLFDEHLNEINIISLPYDVLKENSTRRFLRRWEYDINECKKIFPSLYLHMNKYVADNFDNYKAIKEKHKELDEKRPPFGEAEYEELSRLRDVILDIQISCGTSYDKVYDVDK
jgi:hypothetical protein